MRGKAHKPRRGREVIQSLVALDVDCCSPQAILGHLDKEAINCGDMQGTGNGAHGFKKFFKFQSPTIIHPVFRHLSQCNSGIVEALAARHS